MSVAIDLGGRCAVVTGGARGIGLASAAKLRAAGARVRLWDLDADALAEATAALGEGVDGDLVDITDWDAVRAATARAAEAMGALHIVVNSAGIAGLNASVEDYPVEEWGRILRLNLDGTFHVNKAAVPHLKAAGWGRIVNIASIAGKEGNPRAAAYSASKAGVIGLTKSLGKELAETEIAVNCVTPAAARTRIFDQMAPDFIQFMLSKIPRGRFVEVEEIADMVLFLASPANSFATGGVFDISGGRATY